MSEERKMQIENGLYLNTNLNGSTNRHNNNIGENRGIIVNGELKPCSMDSLEDIDLLRQTSSTIVTPNMDDLRQQLDAFKDVNEHLNGQIEKYTIKIDQLTEERDIWKKRAKELTRKLNDEKKKKDLENGIKDFEGVIKEEDIIAACNEIKGGHEIVDFEADGVYLEQIIKRGKAGGWMINRSEVNLINKIGEGSFGATYIGTWRGAKVCVKCVSVKTKQELISFLREAEALASLRHPNILPFFGACMDAEDSYWLICEYMPKGNLSKWLYGDRQPNRYLTQRLEFALQIGYAMEVCQKSNPPIIHRDIKPSNIFIDAAGNARLGDFGLARRMHPESISTMTNETGTYVYMSPEMIRHEMYDSSTDVWSWGVMLCELVTQVNERKWQYFNGKALPYYGQFLTPVQLAMAVSDNKIKPHMPTDIHPGLNLLSNAIFQHDAAARPTFEVIVSQLSKIIKDLKEQNGYQGEKSFFQKLRLFGNQMTVSKNGGQVQGTRDSAKSEESEN